MIGKCQVNRKSVFEVLGSLLFESQCQLKIIHRKRQSIWFSFQQNIVIFGIVSYSYDSK